jgi:hypothetical protein
VIAHLRQLWLSMFWAGLTSLSFPGYCSLFYSAYIIDNTVIAAIVMPDDPNTVFIDAYFSKAKPDRKTAITWLNAISGQGYVITATASNLMVRHWLKLCGFVRTGNHFTWEGAPDEFTGF